jgi:hypothetical protein
MGNCDRVSRIVLECREKIFEKLTCLFVQQLTRKIQTLDRTHGNNVRFLTAGESYRTCLKLQGSQYS